MIPEWTVMQYTKYCCETNYKPFGHRTMLRILSECSASVRQSLQGLDYFAAEGAWAFGDLASILENASLLRDDGREWSARIMDTLKAGKLYLKSDYKVNCQIQSWKAHQLRSVRQDKSRLDILEQLNNDSIDCQWLGDEVPSPLVLRVPARLVG